MAHTALLLLLALGPAAANYITLSSRYTADPAPFVHDGRLYIYTSHDLDTQRAWLMTDYSLMSTADLANWQDHGIVFDINNQTWGSYAWAQQVIEGPGGFYMYYPGMSARSRNNTRTGTGVAFSASVAGPFNDAIGEPLLPCGDDPTVFRDDDGTVYLCGNCNGPLCARLAPNMTALAEPPAHLSPPLPIFFEAPWLSKWQGVYYLSYMCKGDGLTNFSHYGWDICYGSCSGPACSPLGPYVFRGSLMWNPPNDCGPVNASCADPHNATGENNHQGIVEFPQGSGNLLFAYHSRTLSKSRGAYLGYQRNVAIDRLYARTDARTFPLPPGLPWVANDTAPGAGAGLLPVTSTPAWLRQLAYLDPYTPLPATLSSAQSQGLSSQPCTGSPASSSPTLLCLAVGANASWTELRGLDLGDSPPTSLLLQLATPLPGTVLTLTTGGSTSASPRATLAVCAIPATGGWQAWANVSCQLSREVRGVVSSLRLTFSGTPAPVPGSNSSQLLNLQSLVFEGLGVAPGGGLPPPVTVTLALRAAGGGVGEGYWGVPGPGGALAAGAPAAQAGAFVLADKEDGTYTLSTQVPGAGQRLLTVAPGTGQLLAVGLDAAAPAARFFLYGTTTGSYGLLSAANGLFVAAGEGGGALAAVSSDPRAALGDAARHWLEEAD